MKKDVKLQKTKKKGFPHTQSTNNYCLISSTFQKKFQKKTSIVNLEKNKNDTKNVLYLAQVSKNYFTH